MIGDASTKAEPVNAILTNELIESGYSESQKMSQKVSRNAIDKNEIIPGSIGSYYARRFQKKTVIADSLRIRKSPGLNAEIDGNFFNGEEITVDMDSAKKVDGYTWVKIVSGDKEGWVASEYLENAKPKKEPEPEEDVSYDEPEEETEAAPETEEKPIWDSDHFGWAFLDEKKESETNSKSEALLDNSNPGINLVYADKKTKVNPKLIDPQYIQQEFNKKNNIYNDGKDGLQCPDLPSWYISTHTNLTYGNGDGKDVVDNLVTANSDKLTKNDIVTDPSKVTFPAVYSVPADMSELGTSGSKWGHTGLIVGINEEKGTFLIVHTWNGLKDKEVISVAKEYPIPKDGVKYLNLDKFMKQQ